MRPLVLMIALATCLANPAEDAVAANRAALPDFDSLWNFDAPDSTEGAFRAILPAAKSSGAQVASM